MSREELDACKDELGCPSEVHLSTCPHDIKNIETVTLSADDFDKFAAMLEEPPRELPKLAALMNEMSEEDYLTVQRLVALEKRDYVREITNLHLKLPTARFFKIEKLARKKREQA